MTDGEEDFVNRYVIDSFKLCLPLNFKRTEYKVMFQFSFIFLLLLYSLTNNNTCSAATNANFMDKLKQDLHKNWGKERLHRYQSCIAVFKSAHLCRLSSVDHLWAQRMAVIEAQTGKTFGIARNQQST